MTPTHYDVLGVSPAAPPEVIRASYHALMRRAHPDASESDADLARRLNEARDVLMSPQRRAAYDRSLEEATGREEMDAEDTPVEEPAWGAEVPWHAHEMSGEEDGWPRRDSVAQDPPAPPPYPGPLDHPYYGTNTVTEETSPPLRLRDLWHSESSWERFFTWSWAALSLLGPVLIVISAALGPTSVGSALSNLVFYAIPLVVSLHVARARLSRPKVPKRYILWVFLGLFLLAISLEQVTMGAVIAGWIATFVAAVELKRRRMWNTR